ncbi:hypothetical protein ASPWEDRAFT_452813 [Aspergillus wentii DTO 134E9]|uniref:Uncharacterized protein n=1 Tax=Aspergillus wentii DTO 134E9 TaxID=1073089 RepID=A0A1L9RR54_ASPWE|nr:uncharacterized protein ASPWEDRAFT_452813 [Aspergillus wentii DTO 134E9]KAI9928100.1 hypothetical protein MW887_002133 [Aspergillus wentii]OJJ37421.1 hypothetical protein ASPWEDRAFT_452813 [Aspergillus wentii DTO 134E9]
MYPFLPWSQNQANVRATLSAPTPSIDSASTLNSSFSYGDSLYSSSPISSMPPPPPCSPTDSLLDITPRKSSFSSLYGVNNSCAFPSWPNRPSLLNADSDSSTASAYLSDEDLYTDSPAPSDTVIEEESAAMDPVCGSITTEQQIQQLRAAAEEEEHRARFLAQVQAHARAQQALRVSQLTIVERETTKRSKKRRAFPEKKRRTISSPSKARA